MLWTIADRADTEALVLADRHYNRQKPGTPQFVPPGSCLVLKRPGAFWVTSWPQKQYTKHAWAGAWVCSAFRRESGPLASDLIREAVACTRWHYGCRPLPHGMVTFVDRAKVKPTIVRGLPVWGWVYRKAGFVDIGETKGGLLALGLHPGDMPAAAQPIGTTAGLFS